MEQVKHPTHYNLEGRKECWDEMEEIFGKKETVHFCILSAYKYLYRAGEKGSAEKDLQKAEIFLAHAYEVNQKYGTGNTERMANYELISTVYKMLAEKRAGRGD